MTDVFHIDFDVAGFRKNNLDWSKFRDNYNKVSATKLERGIKPLPLSMLLKLFGPQKVFNTYVISHHSNDLDNQIHGTAVSRDLNMRPGEKDATMTKTVNFPGSGLLTNPTDEASLGEQKPKFKPVKRDGLPSRPAFQRGIRVPGRYFPKPLTAFEEHVGQSSTFSDFRGQDRENRMRTQTPRSVHSQTPTTARGQQTISRRSSRIVKGPMCKATETLAFNTGRTPTWSGRSVATTKSMPTLTTNGISQFHKGSSPEESIDSLSASTGRDSHVNGVGCNVNQQQGDNQNEMSMLKRLRYSGRQVSFPRTSSDFSAVLQGRPKTLHPRDLFEAQEALIHREPRSRTHVGFVDENT